MVFVISHTPEPSALRIRHDHIMFGVLPLEAPMKTPLALPLCPGCCCCCWPMGASPICDMSKFMGQIEGSMLLPLVPWMYESQAPCEMSQYTCRD